MDSITAAIQSGDNYRLKNAIDALSASERSEIVKTEAGKVRKALENLCSLGKTSFKVTSTHKTGN